MSPTPTEVEELARELRLQAWHSDPHQFARWILTRFVRREEHSRKIAALANDISGLMLENDRLRAEVERIRDAARPHLIGLWYDSADLDGEPRGYLCIHCAEEPDTYYPTEAEIPHKPDCALWVKP